MSRGKKHSTKPLLLAESQLLAFVAVGELLVRFSRLALVLAVFACTQTGPAV